MLESVVEGAFAIVKEGIYFIPRPDSPAVIPSSFSTSQPKRSDPSPRSRDLVAISSRFPPMAAGSYTLRLISRVAI